MKKHTYILMLICFATFAQAQNNFNKQWKKVAQFEKEGLTQSAADVVDTIYNDAVSSKNKQQQIKALLYKSKYILILEEDAQLNIVNLFKSEIKNTKSTVTKHLLENMLATMYWQYFKKNRYKFYNRTKTEEKLNDDFRTWDLETLFNEIHNYYQCSLEDEKLLQEEQLEDYKTLLNEAKDSKKYRPSLYDLLCHNALQFYKTSENSITQPSYKFKIDHPDYFLDPISFSNLSITSKDSTSLQLQALKIYQNLLKAHTLNASPLPTISNDIERLKFVFQHATLKTKEELYLNALKKESEHKKTSSLGAIYDFEIASFYQQQGNRYNSNDNEKDQTQRWKLKEAIALCNAVIAKHPESDAAKQCKTLKQQILQPSLRLQTEEFTPINAASRILVHYKNLEQLNFSIYKVDKNQLETYNKRYKTEDKAKFFSKLNPIKTFSSALKSEGDYQQHSTEIILPALANGLYLIKADTNSKDQVFAVAHIQITDLALIESDDNDTTNYQLINRNNGAPIADAVISMSYKNNRNEHFNKMLSTDALGKFQFKKDNNYYRSVEIRTDYKDDTAFFGDYYINRTYKQNTNNDTQYNTFIFTDRSIYRPGQTVYFKGIAIQNKAHVTTVMADLEVSARLYNTNRELLKELKLKTNAYGSVASQFILPNDGLTGQFYIEFGASIVNVAYFSVEEYKRPKFKPEFQPITESYKINDSITVKGKAVAFAGSTITNAKVVYRVKRQVQYPSWWYWRRPNYYHSEAQEITFGEGLTNNKGEFTITFKALPDERVSKDNLPVFNYEVTADITDVNGETRSTTTVVNVGYHAMTLNVIAPQSIDKSKKTIAVTLNSKNLNGEFVAAKGNLKVFKLNAPEHILRARPWVAPDYQVISKVEFKRLFPHDPYNNEHLLTNWEKGDLVFSTNFNTEASKTITLKKLKHWDSGKYIIITESKDKFGQEVKDQVYTTLFSNADKTVADKQLFEATLDKSTYKTGETAKLTVGSAAKNISLTVEVEKAGEIVSTQLVKLNNSKQTITIPIAESDLGGFEIHVGFAAFNAYVQQQFKVNVPYPKTDLDIETTTFRDQLQSGQNETWSFKIKGPKGDKVSAELLASMYDASLDEFRAHNWSFSPIVQPSYYARIYKNTNQSFGSTNFRLFNRFAYPKGFTTQNYDQLNWFGLYFGHGSSHIRSLLAKAPGVKFKDYKDTPEEYIMAHEDDAGNVEVRETDAGIDFMDISDRPEPEVNQILSGQQSNFRDGDKRSKKQLDSIKNKQQKEIALNNIQIRKNLKETAFFFPQLQTDADGNVSFNFKAPETLTKWKLQLLAHTKTLESAVTQLEAVTQKELMVIPNAPRFLREGDAITISTKIANLTDKELSGSAQLILTNPITGKDISEQLISSSPLGKLERDFSVSAKGNTQVSWSLKIPDNIQAVQYKIIAKAGNFSDGEQNALPVLSNRMLVTETLPMWVGANQSKTFTLDKLKSNSSTTLKNHKLTLEVTSNPAWYAVQALPYLMEYPYDCNEQTFSRYYANALAQHIVRSNPKIEAVFNQWTTSTSLSNQKDALLSNLEKNQELKNILIQETPWLRDAQSETEQKKRIALLFDLNKMNSELNSALRKLRNNQLPSGAWPWFNGGYENRYITQHIIAGFGHLSKLGVTQYKRHTERSRSASDNEKDIIKNAIQYLDAQFIKAYKDLTKYKTDADLSKDHLSHIQLHYLYVRSFYPELKPSKEVKKIMDYYHDQIKTYWLSRSLYAKGLMTLVMHRNGNDATASKILKSLKENSITSEELGMYWKENTNSWHWYQAPIETQALMIEVFSEVGKSLYVTLSAVEAQKRNLTDIDNLKIWLLKHKQTNQWSTTKATTEAVYALLLQGNDWLSVTDAVDVTVGNETIDPSTLDNINVEAGTGYFKTSWNTTEIQPEQAKVTLNKKGDGIAWGALYWQYFEDLDKISSEDLPDSRQEQPLQLRKKLFKKTNTAKGEEISEITEDTKLKVGDLMRVRIELRSDRAMEFVHLKDMRAAGLEPVNVLSQYKWQDGLGYYESTKDAATNFFIDDLPKGIYVFEYDLSVNNAGNMSNGISTIQSMYAPEFSSHSEGVRVLVD